MNNVIRLHPQYGINPTMKVCFWCQQETGEILLLGSAYDKEAPMRMVTDYRPCPKCKEIFSQGVALIEATLTKKGPELTGNYWIVTEEAAQKMFYYADNCDSILENKRVLITHEDAVELGLCQKAA